MEKAKKTFEEAIERFPKDTNLKSNFSELLIALGKFEDARKSIEKTIDICSSLEDKQNMEVLQITLVMLIKGFKKAREVVSMFIGDFKFQYAQWDYSDIVPALSDLSEIDRKRIEAVQNLNLGKCSVDFVKTLWDLA